MRGALITHPLYEVHLIALVVSDIIGIYAFAYRKRILEQKQWRILFYVILVDQLFYWVYRLTALSLLLPIYASGLHLSRSWPSLLVGFLLTLPDIYVFYRLAYNKTSR
jgi:hypothetical protein